MSVWTVLAPLLAVAGGGVAVLLLEAFWRPRSKNPLAVLSLAALAAAVFFSVRLWDRDASSFARSLMQDNAALLIGMILILSAAFTIIIGARWIHRQDAAFGEFYGLLLLALSGLMMMASTADLLVVLLGMEVFSVSSYALTGLKRNDEKATEAAAKYFLIGSFAAAIMIFGLAVLFGTAGGFGMAEVVAAGAAAGPRALPLVGLGLFLVGLMFKIALAPFHMWQPDVYEGAPTPVTAFFLTAPKAAGFLVLYRLLIPWWSQGGSRDAVFIFLYAVSALTMVLGNLGALRQKNLKRLFAYSSIGHAGAMLVAVLAGDGSSLVFYLANYLLMAAGAFAALIAMSREGREYGQVEDFAGIGFRYPWIGATLTIVLLSMAGFPPTGGFLAKFNVFAAGVRNGLTPLVVIGVLTSLISVAYYLRIVVFMYMKAPERPADIEVENPAVLLVLVLCLYGILQMGLFPGNVLHFIRQAMASIL